MFADLHIHSKYSDGLLDISSLISDARDKGIEVIALTDHDTINCVIEMKKKIWDIETIPGIEITVSKKMHILGYFIDYKSCMLKKILDRMALKRARWLIRLIREISKEKGVEFGDFLKIYENVTVKTVNRWIRDMGDNRCSKDEVYDMYFWNSANPYGKYPTFSSKEAIDLINTSGGVAVLAHPALVWENKEQFEDLLESLMREGLKGLEVYHVLNAKAGLQEYFAEVAVQKRLLISGGSDFHGDKNKRTYIGEYGLLEKEWEMFRQCRGKYNQKLQDIIEREGYEFIV